MLSKRSLRALIPVVAAFILTGCQPEEKITHAKRPRLNDMKRLLAAIVPPDKNQEDQKTWVFKAVGSESEIERIVEPFNQLVRSIRFTDPDNPTWTLPLGWTEEKDKDNKLPFATIHTGAKGKMPDVTVSAIQGEREASIPENVIGWRMELGLKHVLGTADLEDFYRYEPVGGHVAIVVDMTGPGGANLPPREEPPPPKLPFTYKTPPGWKETRPTSNLSVLSFRPVSKDKKAEITVSIFQGAAGGLAANVNRWRKQVELDDLTPSQIDALPEVRIGNAKGKLVDITGPAAPPQRNRIVGAILMRERDSLFFKMTGPRDFIGEQRPAFETFLESIKFGEPDMIK